MTDTAKPTPSRRRPSAVVPPAKQAQVVGGGVPAKGIYSDRQKTEVTRNPVAFL